MPTDPDAEGNNDEIVPAENMKERPKETPSAADVAANELMFPMFVIEMLDHMHDHVKLNMDTLIELEGNVEKGFDEASKARKSQSKTENIRYFVIAIIMAIIAGLLL